MSFFLLSVVSTGFFSFFFNTFSVSLIVLFLWGEMFRDSLWFSRTIGCFGCFGSTSTRTPQSPERPPLKPDTPSSTTDEATSSSRSDDDDQEEEEEEVVEQKSRSKRSDEILKFRLDHGLICRQVPVKVTNQLIRGEVMM